MTHIPKAPLREFFKEHGAERVADRAITEYRAEIERYCHTLAGNSILLAKHARRKTVLEADVKKVIEVQL
jgi:histone H3/H4